jgi:predicted ester cyclase
MSREENNRQLVHRLRDRLLETRDPDAVDEFFAEGFVSHNMPPGLPQGRDGVKLFLRAFEQVGELDVQIDEMICEDDRVAVATTTSGVHDKELFGMPPTGKRLTVTGIDLIRIEDGLIAEHRGLTDTVGLMRQLSSG